MATPTGTAKEAFWLRHVEAWVRSGIRVRAYCDKHDLSEASFYLWRRTLAKSGLVVWPKSATPKSTTPKSATPRSATPAFVPVRVQTSASDASAASAIELVLGNGRVVRVSAGFDAETLRRLVAALEATEAVEGQPC